jgi:1-acyl-sn-glycerol-3-phosphate acyltransferase
VVLPLLWLRLRVTADPREAFLRVQRAAGRVVRWAGCRIEVDHLDRLPAVGPLMLVSNHASLADAAVLLAVLPLDARFVANHAHARYPILGAAIRAASANIVDRASWRSRADSGRAMVDALASGQSVLVFPEGTTADAEMMLPFRSGAFRAAARTGSPVVPIALRGTRAMLPASGFWLSNAPIRITVLPALTPSDATRAEIARVRDGAAAAIRTVLDAHHSAAR